MSRSPAKAVGTDQAQRYVNAFQQLYTMQAEGRSFSGYERNCVFLNTGGPRFADISSTSGVDFLDDGRGVARVDWDHDGDQDLWISNRSAPQVRFLRNDTPSKNHFVIISLTGTECNRDAIGSRVKVRVRQPKDTGKFGVRKGNNSALRTPNSELIKTLRAGEGFLSQSSKWLHFGLARATQIEQVVIHWPGGDQETFNNLPVDRHYKIVQGTGRAQEWTPPTRQVALEPSSPVAQRAATSGRIVLAGQPELPNLTYYNWENKEVSLNDSLKGPTLINLWASWCRPCIVELNELSEHASELRAADLDVIALSVDGLDDARATTAEDARKFLDQRGLSLETGWAAPELLSKLQTLHDFLFYRVIPLSVPTSFLISADGRVAAIYRGPVSIDQLLEDVRHIGDPPDQLRARAMPFSGRFASEAPLLKLDWLAKSFTENGFHDDAIKFLKQAVRNQPLDAELHMKLGFCMQHNGQLPAATEAYRETIRLDPDHLEANNSLGVLLQSEAKLDEALARFQQVLKVDPDHANAHFNSALILQSQKKRDDASAHYRHALRTNPYLARAHLQLGTILATQGDFRKAATHVRQAVEIDDQFAEAHNFLGRILRQQGRLDDAIAQFRTAVDADPEYGRAHYNLGVSLVKSNQVAERLKHLREATRLEPQWPAPWNSLAWVLATHTNSDVRDPEEAIRCASEAANLTARQDPTVLDTLAVAHASAGEFDQAVKILETAFELASQAKLTSLVKEIRARLELFRQHKPFP